MSKTQTNTGAHVKLSELIQFNQDLIKFKKALNECSTNIEAAIKTLERGWRDEKLVEYKKDFEKYTKLLEPLANELERYEKFMEAHWIPRIKKHLEMKRNG